MNKGKQYPNPKFSSMEEEDKYWEAHSPLDEGFEGEVETSEQKRSSFLSVRMTGDELSQLRDAAAKLGLGPSTYARSILTQVSSHPNWPIQDRFNYLYDNSILKRGSTLKHSAICILDTGDINIDQGVVNSLVEAVLISSKCRMVTPDDADYKKAERLVKV